MLPSYKLRLSDGTLLVVDHDGLSTWLVDDKAMVQLVGSSGWRPLKAFLATERAAARNASRPNPSAAPTLPLTPPPPRHEGTPGSAEPPPSDLAPFFVGEPPVEVQPKSVETDPTPQDDHAAWSTEASRRLDEVLPEPAAPRGPRREAPAFLEAPAQTPAEDRVSLGAESTSPPLAPTEHVDPIRPKAVADEVRGEPFASRWSEPMERRSVERPPRLLVLADDLEAAQSGDRLETSAADDGLPIIRLKPREDRDEVLESVGPPDELPTWQDPRDEKLFRAVAAVGGFLSVWLGRLGRQLGRLSSIRPQGRAPQHGPRGNRAHRLVGAGAALLAPWVDRLGRQRRRLLSISTDESAPSASRRSGTPEVVPALGTSPRLQVLAEELTDSRHEFARGRATPDPAPNEPHGPPLPIRELPILGLADLDEPEAANDAYEGDGSLGRTAWRWTKRVVVVGGLLAGGILAAQNRQSWLPKAERLSRSLFAEIDKQARSRDLTERRRRALQEATEQLPYLAPETIELVLSGGALDLPDVFHVASDATDRGLSALAPGEAQERKALWEQALDTLHPSERQRIREYDGARRRRLTLPFEDRDVIELFARAARALPAGSRARLQVLSGKAIAAGLALDRRSDVMGRQPA